MSQEPRQGLSFEALSYIVAALGAGLFFIALIMGFGFGW